jgi:hypothetical protein
LFFFLHVIFFKGKLGNKIKKIRKYKTGGHKPDPENRGINLTQKTTKTTQSGWYNKSSHKWYKKDTTLNNHYHGQSSEPTYRHETELQKNAEWPIRAYKRHMDRLPTQKRSKFQQLPPERGKLKPFQTKPTNYEPKHT